MKLFNIVFILLHKANHPSFELIHVFFYLNIYYFLLLLLLIKTFNFSLIKRLIPFIFSSVSSLRIKASSIRLLLGGELFKFQNWTFRSHLLVLSACLIVIGVRIIISIILNYFLHIMFIDDSLIKFNLLGS